MNSEIWWGFEGSRFFFSSLVVDHFSGGSVAQAFCFYFLCRLVFFFVHPCTCCSPSRHVLLVRAFSVPIACGRRACGPLFQIFLTSLLTFPSWVVISCCGCFWLGRVIQISCIQPYVSQKVVWVCQLLLSSRVFPEMFLCPLLPQSSIDKVYLFHNLVWAGEF